MCVVIVVVFFIIVIYLLRNNIYPNLCYYGKYINYDEHLLRNQFKKKKEAMHKLYSKRNDFVIITKT